MNLSQLRTHVRTLTGIPSTTILSDADLNVFINEAYNEILREADWPFMRAETTLNLVPGQAEYTTSVAEGTIASIVSLSNDTNRRQLRPRNLYSTDDSPGPLSTGYPYEYSAWTGGKLRFFPTPDQAETLTIRHFYQSLPDLANNTDQPTFDSKFHTLVAYGAAVRVLIREGDDTDRKNYYQGQFVQGVDQMKGYYLTDRDRSIFRIGGRRRVFGRRDNRYGV